MMSFSSSVAVVLLSLSAIPITYSVNLAQDLQGEGTLLVVGTTALTVLCVLIYLFASTRDKSTDLLYYAMACATFGGVASLLVALEADGYISGFMKMYLERGEPYLGLPYGTMVSLWDGTVHYLLCLRVLLGLHREDGSYRNAGLLWAGSIGHSMVVFMPGNVLGKHGLRWSFLLNIPYCFIPFMCAARFLRERPKQVQGKDEAHKHHSSIITRPIDILMVLGLLASLSVAVFRGFAVLGANNSYMKDYIKNCEPYLTDPNTYPKMQMLIYLFYFAPYYIMGIYGLLYPGCSWMPDWALLHAGAAGNAQFSHIGGALHFRTPANLRVPADAQLVFWLINAGLFIFPQILALRCYLSHSFFIPTKEVSILEKKQK